MSEEINKINVCYDENDNRLVTCFCGKVCKISLVPHLKKDHSEKWDQWRLDFVRLKNKGWSYKRIMWKYRAIFSWSVIDREIRNIVQEGKATLETPRKKNIQEWNIDPSLETTTVWDFKNRGDWSVHRDDYRGNWPPQIPRNLILKYTQEGAWILDPFIGGGTTLIEAYRLKRKSIGIDINPQAVKLTKEKIQEMEEWDNNKNLLQCECRPLIFEGDAEKILKDLESRFAERLDLICGHPPYMDSIVYTKNEFDLSNFKDVDAYCKKIGKIAQELFILLKNEGKCGILIGDIRRESKIIPLGFKVMNQFLDVGFSITEIIMKVQHQDKSTRFYENRNLDHYLIQHEYMFIFEK